jgi:pyruvate kinase
VELRVIDRRDETVVTEVVQGGELRSRAGVNVPCERLSWPSLTEKDRADVPRAIAFGAELIAQSFVMRAEDVKQLRQLIDPYPICLIAKIETRGAIEAVDQILDLADGIMVARGDLGAEIPFEEIPAVQKHLVERAQKAGKPAVVATEMLHSMTGSIRPTRAEASDVANSVFEGAAGILLSAETAIGTNPVEAARAAARILEAAERSRWSSEHGSGQRAAGSPDSLGAGATPPSQMQRVG